MITTLLRWMRERPLEEGIIKKPNSTPSCLSEKTTWKYNEHLLDFIGVEGGKEVPISMKLGHSFQGILCFGRTGSGKTTGSGQTISRAMLRKGFGGLVLCAKPDEADDWEQRCKDTGRSADLVRFNAESPYRFNFLDYELKEGSKNVEGVVGLLLAMAEVISESDNNVDVWERSAREMLRNALTLLHYVGEEITPETILRACVEDHEFGMALINRAKKNPQIPARDMRVLESYYTKELKGMADRTRYSIIMTLKATLGNFTRGPISELFCTTTNITPMVCRQGKILVIDMPIKVWNELGTLAAAVWKVSFQRAIERYKADDSTRPVFLYADEAQFFVAAKSDGDFQTTARSSRCATLYLTQNYPTLKAKFGGDVKAEAKAKGLIGNLVTRIYHANDCPETNQLACEMSGKTIVRRETTSSGASLGGPSVGVNAGSSFAEAIDLPFAPDIFRKLVADGKKVTALLDSAVVSPERPVRPIKFKPIFRK